MLGIQTNRLRYIIRYVFDRFFDKILIRFLPRYRQSANTLLLIRLDAIGDYVLFRNFIEVLKKSRKYSKYKLTLLGNIAWKDLAESLDQKNICDFLWLNRKKFRKSPLYRFSFVRKIRLRGFETVIHPVYSRDFFWGDIVTFYSGALHRIAPGGDISNMNFREKLLTDSYYTQLIHDRQPIRFEFERNRFFFERLLAERIPLKKPVIHLKSRATLRESYCIFFPGASQTWKRWPIEYFATIAKDILKDTNLIIYVCGSQDESYLGERLAQLCENNGRVRNFCGKTTLPALAGLLAGAKILISNDTSAAHIAVAVGTKKILTLFAGNHYGRFLPYPKRIHQSIQSLTPDNMPGKTRLERFQDPAGGNLTTLSPLKVRRALRKMHILP